MPAVDRRQIGAELRSRLRVHYRAAVGVATVDHIHVSAQPDRMGAAGFGLAIGSPLVVEIAQDRSRAPAALRRRAA